MVDALFWVRVLDLPFMVRNKYIERPIGNAFGRFEKVDLDNSNVECGEFMHIRVSTDITKPLSRKNRLNISLPEAVWLNFKYEQLPNFYFYCDVLDHGHKDCKIWKKASKTYKKESLPYDNSLRVSFHGGTRSTSKQPPTAQPHRGPSPAFPTTPNQTTTCNQTPTNISRKLSVPNPTQNGTTEVTLGDRTSNLFNFHEKGKGSMANGGNGQEFLSWLSQGKKAWALP